MLIDKLTSALTFPRGLREYIDFLYWIVRKSIFWCLRRTKSPLIRYPLPVYVAFIKLTRPSIRKIRPLDFSLCETEIDTGLVKGVFSQKTLFYYQHADIEITSSIHRFNWLLASKPTIETYQTHSQFIKYWIILN